MNYDFKILKDKAKGIEDWLKKEYMGLRTGIASTSILDGISIDAYGSKMPLNQVANIGTEDARTIRITPWDKTQSKAIEKAITVADLGVSVGADDKGVRVSFPELTTERRGLIIKTAKQKLEDARINLRKVREEVWGDIQDKEKEGVLTEDEQIRYKKEMQKYIDESNMNLESFFDKKEKEINS